MLSGKRLPSYPWAKHDQNNNKQWYWSHVAWKKYYITNIFHGFLTDKESHWIGTDNFSDKVECQNIIDKIP